MFSSPASVKTEVQKYYPFWPNTPAPKKKILVNQKIDANKTLNVFQQFKAS